MPEIPAETSGAVSQAELLEAFGAGRIEGVKAPVERVDTHLNVIFLAGEQAFKLKRAIQMPFVDFSTPERRRIACQAEYDINHGFGSPFYVRVSPVVERPDGHLALGGEGAIRDWVVVMRRFDRTLQFDALARAGRLGVPLIGQTAERIAALHAAAPIIAVAGHAADYRHILRQLKETEADGAARLGLSLPEDSLYARLDSELTRVGPLLERRRRAGKVRRGHGDLHLRNICLFEGAPTPFDALEFDARMATSDVLYDLAFLLMDLRRCDLPRQANAAMNRYWDIADESEEGLELLPFFTSLRAGVRMAVAVEAGDPEEASVYRRLAHDLLKRHDPRCVAIGGLSGSGKSTVAAELAFRLPGPAGARLLRSDVLRKREFGAPITQHAPPEAYAPGARGAVYRELASRTGAAFRAGASVLADATFLETAGREAVEAIGADVRAFWLDAPLALREARVRSRQGDASDADAAVLAGQQEPLDLSPAWARLDAVRPAEETAMEILNAVRAPAPRSDDR